MPTTTATGTVCLVKRRVLAQGSFWLRIRQPKRRLTGTYKTPQGTVYYYDDGTTRYQP